jgi:hypothetical protein
MIFEILGEGPTGIPEQMALGLLGKDVKSGLDGGGKVKGFNMR